MPVIAFIKDATKLTAGFIFIATLLCGCAGKTSRDPIFWPAAPDFPRIQFLFAIKDSSSIIEQKGLNLFSSGGESSETIPITKPYGISVHNGTIYLTDTLLGEVLIIDPPNKKMRRLPGNVNMGKLKKPGGIDVDDDGNIYVADSARSQVLQYDSKGQFTQVFANTVSMRPTDVKAEEDFLYILDGSQHRILIFNRKTGDLLREAGQDGPEDYRLSLPLGLATNGKGVLYTTNFSGKLIAYDRDGHFVKAMGQLGKSFGDFGRPRGIAIDRNHLIYVVDAALQHVQIFDEKLLLLLTFGGPGTYGSLNVPAGIAVSYDNLDYYQKFAAPDFKLEYVIFVVSQFGDGKINIYGIGKKAGLDYEAEYQKIKEEFIRLNKEAEERLKAEKESKDAPKDDKGKNNTPSKPSTLKNEGTK